MDENKTMGREQIRNDLLQKLKEVANQEEQKLQIANLIDPYRSNKSLALHEKSQIEKIIFDIVHEWARAGVVYLARPGELSTGFPFITITDFGKRCIESGNFLPYDPDGYIQELKRQVPLLDSVTLAYLQESVATYNSENLLSATVTLGVASENIILLLIDVFVNAVKDKSQKNSIKKTLTAGKIYVKYLTFVKLLKQYKKNIPEELLRDVEPQLHAVFNFIRLNRNQAGHPTGMKSSKKVIYSNLQIFAEYSKAVFDLIGYFKKNKI